VSAKGEPDLGLPIVGVKHLPKRFHQVVSRWQQSLLPAAKTLNRNEILCLFVERV
jgi:hypothetical protein